MGRWVLDLLLDFFMGLEEDGADVFYAVGSGKEPAVERGGEVQVAGVGSIVLVVVAEHAVEGALNGAM